MNYEIEEIVLIQDDLQERTQKSIKSYQAELSNLRAGRANMHILNGINVDYYGTATPLNQVSNITIPEARMLCITVWDNSLIKKVEKAIIDANVGIMPTNDGKVIRLVFPEPTEERRKALVKDVKSLAEKAKIAVRNIRRDSIEETKKLKKQGTLAEDIQISVEKDIDKYITQQIAEIDRISAAKEEEIMTV